MRWTHPGNPMLVSLFSANLVAQLPDLACSPNPGISPGMDGLRTVIHLNVKSPLQAQVFEHFPPDASTVLASCGTFGTRSIAGGDDVGWGVIFVGYRA